MGLVFTIVDNIITKIKTKKILLSDPCHKSHRCIVKACCSKWCPAKQKWEDKYGLYKYMSL